MVASVINESELFSQDDGINTFIQFLHAVWRAKDGDAELLACFKALQLDLNLHPLALFGYLMSRKPLSADQASILKKILELGGK